MVLFSSVPINSTPRNLAKLTRANSSGEEALEGRRGKKRLYKGSSRISCYVVNNLVSLFLCNDCVAQSEHKQIVPRDIEDIILIKEIA